MGGMSGLAIFLTLMVALSPVFPAKYKFTGFKNTITISEIKEWKKTLKTRNNILAVFTDGEKYVKDYLAMFEKVSENIRGKASVLYIDCSSAKKLCKNLKIKPSPYSLRHYSEGKFNKEYDRLMEEKSMLSFLEDPSSDPPWSEDPSANHVRHVEGPQELDLLLRTEKKPILMMFYAPWCGHCKSLKPHIAAAATEVRGQYVLAGMDVNTPESFGVREEYNITGFPTLVYFKNGKKHFDYGGGRDKEGILEWLKDPQPPEVSPSSSQQEEAPWSEVESEVVHLTTQGFDDYMETHPSVLIMFYAPWCGHCKAMKPAYMEAAVMMKEQEVGGILAAVDATKEAELGDRYGVKGYPTIKYFGEGGVQYDYGYGREAEDLVNFMREPLEPPPPEKEWAEIESAVTHLTEEDFKTSLKKKKHALVMFYAPWCGHCKAAKPEFTASAEEFSGEKKLAFGALDCTKSRSVCDKYEVKGYPTFIYFNYGKNPAPYNGARNSEGFSQFMANPSTYIHNEL